jgi:hypothetical protein
MVAVESVLPSLHLMYPSRLDVDKVNPMITRTNHFSLKENKAVKKNRT